MACNSLMFALMCHRLKKAEDKIQQMLWRINYDELSVIQLSSVSLMWLNVER
jgi:hypothetical protein